jgi:Na+-driven multidrug efflux pump
MKYVAAFYVIAVINTTLSTAIQSFGYSIFCTANSVVSVLLFRAFWMYFIYPISPTFDTLMLCFLVSWSLIMVVYLTFYFYVYYAKFKKNKLKKMG